MMGLYPTESGFAPVSSGLRSVNLCRFFLRLERKRGTESWVSAMRVSNWVVVTDAEGIFES